MDFVLSELTEQVLAARGAEKPLVIRGGGTKQFYGEPKGRLGLPGALVLDMTAYQGIVNYHPSELVVTVKAGTLLSDLEKVLDEQGQMLAFEPPRFGPASTVGGCVAAGLSGPRRMAAGSLRDFILGARLLDSSGAVLAFGGEVMKNVAGYDVSRLLAGSLGIYGALVDISIKVAPKPFVEQTRIFQVEQAQALALLNQWRSQPVPISATSWSDHAGQGVLHVRLSGSDSAVDAGARRLGGQALPETEAADWWNGLRDQTHPFFSQRPIWRIAVPPTAPDLKLGATLVEWNGAQRWVAAELDPVALRSRVSHLGGHATFYRAAQGVPGVADPVLHAASSDASNAAAAVAAARSGSAENASAETTDHVAVADIPFFQPLSPVLRTLNWRLKQELDPVGLFNPKRLFPDF